MSKARCKLCMWVFYSLPGKVERRGVGVVCGLPVGGFGTEAYASEKSIGVKGHTPGTGM